MFTDSVKLSEDHLHNKVSLLSFVCSILIIYYHAFNLNTYGINSGLGVGIYYIETYWSKITEIAVPFFFFVSALLFYRYFDMKKLWDKWKLRIRSILIPYIVWCLIYYFYYVACTNIPFLSVLTKTESISFGFVEAVKWIVIKEYYTLWFLKNLIIYVFVAPVIWYLFKDRGVKIKTGLIALVVSVTVLYLRFFYSILIDGLEFYLVGAYIGINHKSFYNCSIKVIQKISFKIIIGILLFLIIGRWNFALKIVFILSTWYAFDFFELEKINIKWWMKITFFTYVAHDLFLEAFEKIYLVVLGKRLILALLDYVFMPIIVFALLVGIAYFLKKFTPGLWNVVCGGR